MQFAIQSNQSYLQQHSLVSTLGSTNCTYNRSEHDLAFVAGKVVLRPLVNAAVQAWRSIDKRISNLFSLVRGAYAAKVDAEICNSETGTCLGKPPVINKPLLVLHFDINKTLTLKDSTKAKFKPEQMIASILAEFTFSKWSDDSSAMSFTAYVEQVLVPGDKWDADIKNKRQELIFGFLDWLKEKEHPQQLEVFEKYEEVKRLFTDPSTKELKFTVFQSFYTLLNALRAKDIRFIVLLRTFSKDLNEVAQEISSHPSGIQFTRYGTFESNKLNLEGAGTVEGVDRIFQTFVESKEHFAIRDNWSEWNAGKKRAEVSKLFPYDATGKYLSIFCDDNYTGNEEDDIVNPVRVSGDDQMGEALKCTKIFTAHPLEAALNPNYYIDRVNQVFHCSGYKESI